MKKIILALFLVSVFSLAGYGAANAQPTQEQVAAEEHKQEFCKDMAGMALVMSQFKDQGLTMIRAVSEFQDFLKTHPDFPATEEEKEYAISVIKTIYKFPTLKGETLGNYIYDQCLAGNSEV